MSKPDTFTKLHDAIVAARVAYAVGGINGARSQIKQMFDVWDQMVAESHAGEEGKTP